MEKGPVGAPQVPDTKYIEVLLCMCMYIVVWKYIYLDTGVPQDRIRMYMYSPVPVHKMYTVPRYIHTYVVSIV